jgi:glycosyltransferase involved in cell wall biosynthesis
MRVLHVNEYDRPGGAETTIFHLLKGLNAAGVKSELFHFVTADGQFFGTEAAFKECLDNLQPDLIHLHNVGVWSKVLDLAMETKLPLVWTLHDYWAICFHRLLMRDGRQCELPCKYECGDKLEGIQKFVEESKVKLLVESPGAQRIFQDKGFYPDRVTCGVDLDFFKYHRGPREGIFFARADQISWWKGQHVAERIARQLSEPVRVAVGTIEGGMPFTQIGAAIGQCKISLVPSLYPETFCRLVLESKACGTVPVAFDAPGPKYQIKDGVTGFLARQGNELELLEKAKLALQVDEEFRFNLRRDVEKNWSLDKMIREHIEVYDRLLTRDRR